MVSVAEGLQRVRAKIQPLGNHLERFLLIVEKRIGPLLNQLEEKGLRHRVWLWDVAQDLPGEMDVVLRVGRNLEEKLSFLGTYHALQLVHMNLALLDTHALEMSRSNSSYPPMRNFLWNSAEGFQRMVGCYISRVLGLLLPPEKAPEFALLNVGGRWDRDDLDICIIDDGSARRDNLRRAIARLSTEMLRYATRLDFHVAEEVGGNRYSASVNEYRLFLRRSPRDFVSASEMLNADIMLGSRNLFDLFKAAVKPLFLYRSNASNLYHEAYLRGSLGEAMILATRPVDETALRPKEDAIRSLKVILGVSRALHNLEGANPFDQMAALRRRVPDKENLYSQLEEHLLFFECFRQLYHFHVEEAEEIHLGQDIPLESRLRIAELMGYQSAGTVDAWEGLVFRYHQKVRMARRLILDFAELFKVHLQRITVFRPFLELRSPSTSPPKKALAAIFSAGRHLRGAGFWDDLLAALEERPEILEDLIQDFLALAESRRKRLLRRIAAGVHRTTRGVMRLITNLYAYQRVEGVDGVIRELVAGFLATLGSEPDLPARLVHVFFLDSKLVCDFLGGLTENEQHLVAQVLRVVEEEEDVPGSDQAYQLRRLCRLFYSHSRYFQRFFLRVVERHPFVVPHLAHRESLDRIIRGLGAFGPGCKTPQERRQALGDAFDIEVVQLGLLALNSPRTGEMRDAFSRFFGPYLASLFRVCRQEALESAGAFHMIDADMAVFITGGTARGDAFAEDCDLFGICAREADVPFFTKVLAAMGRELGQRGLLPHYCLTEAVGESVCTPARLEEHFAAQRQAPVVETSILLGAQLAVGGERFKRDLQELVRRQIYDRAGEYIRGMAAQVENIHQDPRGYYDLDLKDGPGGFRTQEMALLMLKSWGRVSLQVGPALARDMATRWPDIGPALEELAEAMDFLRSLRDIYWVTVSATNTIDEDYLHRPARFMGIAGKNAADRGKRLLDRFRLERERAGQACLEISRWLLGLSGG